MTVNTDCWWFSPADSLRLDACLFSTVPGGAILITPPAA
jgi:hypothetical protein